MESPVITGVNCTLNPVTVKLKSALQVRFWALVLSPKNVSKTSTRVDIFFITNILN
jgi:hypothetical protein